VEINPLDQAENHSLSKGRNLEGARSPELTRETAEQQRIATAMWGAKRGGGPPLSMWLTTSMSNSRRQRAYMRQAAAGSNGSIARPRPRGSGDSDFQFGPHAPAASWSAWC
jgi:hypothetical protein